MGAIQRFSPDAVESTGATTRPRTRTERDPANVANDVAAGNFAHFSGRKLLLLKQIKDGQHVSSAERLCVDAPGELCPKSGRRDSALSHVPDAVKLPGTFTFDTLPRTEIKVWAMPRKPGLPVLQLHEPAASA